MYLQLKEMLLLRKLTSEEVREPKLCEREIKCWRDHEWFMRLNTRTEKAKNEFIFRTARIVNRLQIQIDFTKMIDLKKRILKVM